MECVSQWSMMGLFKIFENENEKARIAFLGEAGVGKTTLLAKITHDWAMGNRLQGRGSFVLRPLA